MNDKDIHVTKLTKIGNSQTLRIPKRFVDKYFPDGEIVLTSTDEGLLISRKTPKLSYKDAALEMAKEAENWEKWHVFEISGIEGLGDW